MITFMESFLQELEQESVGTRKMLVLVPADKPDWKPHEKSMTLKDLATHLAYLPNMIDWVLTSNETDFGTMPYKPDSPNGGEELVVQYDKNVAIAKQLLQNNIDDVLDKNWILRSGVVTYLNLTKLEALRHAYSQMVHHRAQLGLYLRLLSIPIPGVYGPSADEM
jgi:uncharacterized damage-inducible protein DinB